MRAFAVSLSSYKRRSRVRPTFCDAMVGFLFPGGLGKARLRHFFLHTGQCYVGRFFRNLSSPRPPMFRGNGFHHGPPQA
jgi:hypothetical protein